MDLSTVTVADESTWDVSSPDDRDGTVDDEPELSHTPAFSEHGDDPSRPSSETESDQDVNFVTRERRPSDQQRRWKRTGERMRFDPSRSRRLKQEFLAKNNCWNCGEPGHFLVECPKQKGHATAATASGSASSKPLSKKF
jgi:hypothetical protein